MTAAAAAELWWRLGAVVAVNIDCFINQETSLSVWFVLKSQYVGGGRRSVSRTDRHSLSLEIRRIDGDREASYG